MRNKNKNEDGFAIFLLVILILVVAFVTTTIIGYYSDSSVRIAMHQQTTPTAPVQTQPVQQTQPKTTPTAPVQTQPVQ